MFLEIGKGLIAFDLLFAWLCFKTCSAKGKLSYKKEDINF